MTHAYALRPRIARWVRPRANRALRSMLSLMLAASVVPMAFAPATAVAAGAVTTSHLYCVDFVDENTGYAAGAGGTVVKTTDGGATWSAVLSPGTAHEFRGIGFEDANNGWIMSRAGVGFKTADGGATWTSLTADIGDEFYVGETIYAMARLGSQEAVAVGAITGKPGVGFHKYSGTNSWLSGGTIPELWAGTYDPAPELPPTPKEGLGEFYGVDFVSSARGWAVGHDRYEGVVPAANAPIIWDYDSTRGNRWARQTVTGTGPLYDVAFSTTTQGVAVGSAGKTYHTSNAGGTWTAGTAGSSNLFGVELTTGGQGWAVGSSGVIYRSTDNGANWTGLTSPTSYQLEDIEWLTGDTAIAVGASGTIVRTTNGTSWAVSNTGVPTSPPVMNTLTSSSHPSESEWVKNATVSAAWTATAGSSAITGYGLTIDAVSTTAPSTVTHAGTSGTVTATGSGTWHVHVRAKDSANQWSNTLHREVKVDVTTPVATFSPAASYNGSASIPLTATDAHSGVASVSYKIDGGSTTTVSGTSTNVVLSTPGTYQVTYWATDNVDNILGQTTKQVTVLVKSQPVSGAGRYATAIESAKLHFTTPMAAGPDGQKWVVIASGTNWPDALAASGLAGALEAPLLLTTPDDLRDEVASYITQLGATRAAIVGGEAAVSPEVAADLAGLVGGAANVKRYGAGSRYATAELIATKTVGVSGRAAWDKVAFLSTGGNFPDALAAAPLSAAEGRPLYLALPKTGVSDATIAAMLDNGVERVIVLGGSNAVPDSSITRLKAAGIVVGDGDRWKGTDRYDTGRVVAEKSISEGGLNAEFSGLATGENFPDALAGGVVQGLSGSVLVLTQSSVLSPAAYTYFTAHKGEIAEIRFFGGTSAVATSVRSAALAAATP